MKISNFVNIVLLLYISCPLLIRAQYEPNWDSLNSRPLPSWYDEAKFGIFIHWGLFSVPSYSCPGLPHAAEWYWWNLENSTYCVKNFHDKVYGADFTYPEFTPMFTADLFDPNQWATLFKNSGAKYVVFTSKHHDGFTNWKSDQAWNWNSVETGPHLDIVGELTNAIKGQGLRMGLYHSLFEWFNPLFLQDVANNGTTNLYVTEILLPQLYDMVNSYLPDIVWADGAWSMNSTYFDSPEFVAWLYNESPVKDEVCINDRWGEECECVNGGYFTCHDRFNPGHLLNHKWENAMTIDSSSWGYNRVTNISGYLTIENIIDELVSTVSCGGNLLLNIGPASDGTIHPIFQERLLQIGSWLEVNGKSIYNTVPWRAQNDSEANVWYTSNNETVYAIFLEWPEDNILLLTEPVPIEGSSFKLIGSDLFLDYSYQNEILQIDLSDVTLTSLPCDWAWVIAMNGVK